MIGFDACRIEAQPCSVDDPAHRHDRKCRLGAVPVAEIVPRDPANPPKISALAAYCRGALARYKVPVEFKLVESVPLTPSGKIQR